MSDPHLSRVRRSVLAANAAAPAARYLCVHGHFYQPPRENPWLETVELQESAAPYHDWNERITAECYAPNGASRIQNLDRQITRILNNYARMSFNFGPTLLSWLENFAPRTYRMIQEADRASAERFSGHGSALAQVYNHIIMPLADERDARTQIRWGIADFEHRFGRKPEGMWLAETAVNRHVLDLLAQEGIRFTILAPHQCARVRKLREPAPSAQSPAQDLTSDALKGISFNSSVTPDTEAGALAPEATPWTETPKANVDPTHPYRVPLDGGRSIDVFFYDGPNSRAVAFEGLLNSGESFGRRLISGLRDTSEPQLAHIATDGESYGHHHKQGEMALSYALHWIEENNLATLTNYGEFLAKFPPQYEAEVVEDSSWSCSHGVERWRSDCGCNGGKQGWNQQWRGPLRAALDYLRDATAPLAEAVAASLLKDLWTARDAYIEVVLDRSATSIDAFLSRHASHELTAAERVTVLELLELERHTQLMYTSCGWFFDEISGIETVQIIAYAGRVIQLAEGLFGEAAAGIETGLLDLLAQAKSNVLEMGDGAQVYRRYVTAARLDLDHVGAHYAISTLFRSTADAAELFCFDVARHSYELLTSGRGRVALGRVSLRSRITEECEEICFAVLHLGDQNLSAAIKRFAAAASAENPARGRRTDVAVESWEQFVDRARTAIRRANLPELIRLIDSYFGGTLYSLTSLFADEQQRILRSILDQTVSELESSLTRIYEEHATLLDFLSESSVPTPPALALTAGFAINAGLRRALEAPQYDTGEVARLLERARIDAVTLDATLLAFTADKRMKRAMTRLETAMAPARNAGIAPTHTLTAEMQANFAILNETVAIADSLRTLPFEINLWQSQNIWNDLLQRTGISDDPGDQPPAAYTWPAAWREGFRKLGLTLNIAVDDLVVEEGVTAF
jgi:alpha-amylase/alpha-mannosidase (GH57 family)